MASRSRGGARGRRDRATVFQREFRQDLRHWVDTDRRVALRVLSLVEATLRDPASGLGKPELLRHLGANVWSRRITQEHRLVYLVLDDRDVAARRAALPCCQAATQPKRRPRGRDTPSDTCAAFTFRACEPLRDEAAAFAV